MTINVAVNAGLREEEAVASDEWLVASKRSEKKERGGAKLV